MTNTDMRSESEHLNSIANYLAISDHIHSSGQPTSSQFALIKQAGFQVVINLALPTSANALPNEGELVTQLGMTYIHIPVQWEQPADEDFTQFMLIMDAYEDKNVFVHCALNMRVSCFLYLYRIIKQSIDRKQAMEDMVKIWQPDQTWQQFLSDVLSPYISSGAIQ